MLRTNTCDHVLSRSKSCLSRPNAHCTLTTRRIERSYELRWGIRVVVVHHVRVAKPFDSKRSELLASKSGCRASVELVPVVLSGLTSMATASVVVSVDVFKTP